MKKYSNKPWFEIILIAQPNIQEYELEFLNSKLNDSNDTALIAKALCDMYHAVSQDFLNNLLTIQD